MPVRPAARPYLWPLLLAGVTIAGTLVTACMMPFVALATVAAATTARGQAIVTVLGAWAVNQLLGFGLLGYPLDAGAVGWGVALLIATLAVVVAVRAMLGRRRYGVEPTIAAFVGGFALFELLLFGWALVAGGTDTFAPAIVARLFVNEAGWLAVLLVLRALLARAAPAWAGVPAR